MLPPQEVHDAESDNTTATSKSPLAIEEHLYEKGKDSEGRRTTKADEIKMVGLAMLPQDLESHIQLNQSRFSIYDDLLHEVTRFIELQDWKEPTEWAGPTRADLKRLALAPPTATTPQPRDRYVPRLRQRRLLHHAEVNHGTL